MTKEEKTAFREAFFRKAGANLLSLKRMLDTLPDVAFYIKDTKQRIVALNRRNCEICNIRDEFDAVGYRSDELFPNVQAAAYMSADRAVIRTGEPIVNVLSPYPADRSASFTYKSVFPVVDGQGRIIGTTCLYRLVPNPEKVPSWHGLMKQITGYINEHYAESITVEHLAKISGTSVSKFTRAFVRTFDISPGKYISNIRLTAARQLLEHSDKPLVDIAQETGYYDLSHFTRAFRGEFGKTPGRYRREHLKLR